MFIVISQMQNGQQTVPATLLHIFFVCSRLNICAPSGWWLVYRFINVFVGLVTVKISIISGRRFMQIKQRIFNCMDIKFCTFSRQNL